MAYGLARISILSGTSLDQLITRRSGGSEPKRRRWRMKRGERVRKQGVLRPMGARRLCFRVGNEKSHLRNPKRFHSRYNFGYGILLYIRKMLLFRPLTAHFSGFEGVFSIANDKSAILCPGMTEAADFVRLRVQSFND